MNKVFTLINYINVDYINLIAQHELLHSFDSCNLLHKAKYFQMHRKWYQQLVI